MTNRDQVHFWEGGIGWEEGSYNMEIRIEERTYWPLHIKERKPSELNSSDFHQNLPPIQRATILNCLYYNQSMIDLVS